MSYRCEVCRAPSQPGRPRLVHRVLRPDGSIRTELSVCRVCDGLLKKGAVLSDLVREHNAAPLLPQAPPTADAELGKPVSLFD